MRISDWSSDVCSSDLRFLKAVAQGVGDRLAGAGQGGRRQEPGGQRQQFGRERIAPVPLANIAKACQRVQAAAGAGPVQPAQPRRKSEEHTSELQSLMRISYAVFCLKKKTQPPI